MQWPSSDWDLPFRSLQRPEFAGELPIQTPTLVTMGEATISPVMFISLAIVFTSVLLFTVLLFMGEDIDIIITIMAIIIAITTMVIMDTTIITDDIIATNR